MMSRGLSSHGLKITAAVTMTIDHIGATLLMAMLSNADINAGLTSLFSLSDFPEEYRTLVAVYSLCRLIGRIAFPIFCFLAAEGYRYSSNIVKYLLRLFIFALISEVPFDSTFFGSAFYMRSQNVLFTLIFGVIALAGYDKFTELLKRFKSIPTPVRQMLALLSPAICMVAAKLFRCDYQMFGVMLIFVFGVLRPKPKYRNFAALCACAWEITAPLALIPICMYNGEKGRGYKYTFYVFYPAHMIVLKLITDYSVRNLFN